MVIVNLDVVRSETCASAFRGMFWAVLFCIDFRLTLNGVSFDLLPDLFGWLLFAVETSKILNLSSSLAPLRTLLFWLLVLSLFDFVELRVSKPTNGLYFYWAWSNSIINVVTLVLQLIFVWRLSGLVIAMAGAVGSQAIQDKAEFGRKFFVVATVLLPDITLILQPSPQLALMFGLVSMAAFFVAIGLMMSLMSSTARMCSWYMAQPLGLIRYQDGDRENTSRQYKR